jgi:dTDP-4-dehydrorhamnose reductase
LDEYCIVRLSVIYGSLPANGKVNFALWVIEKLRINKSINVVVDQWNSPSLNTNLAEMIIEVMERRLTGIYHLAGAIRINRYEFAKLIAEAFNLDETLIRPISQDEISWISKRPRDSSLNVGKAIRVLSNKPYTIREALKILKRELEYYK